MALNPYYVYKPEEGTDVMAQFLLGKERLGLERDKLGIEERQKDEDQALQQQQERRLLRGQEQQESRLEREQQLTSEDRRSRLALDRAKADQELTKLESYLINAGLAREGQRQELELGKVELRRKQLENMALEQDNAGDEGFLVPSNKAAPVVTPPVAAAAAAAAKQSAKLGA